MNFYELKIKINLLNNIYLEDVSFVLGVFINNSLLKNSILKKIHEEKRYKYVYDSLYPIEKDKIYKKGNTYTFRIRSISIQLLNKIAMVIFNHEYNGVRAIDVDLINSSIDKINEIYTLKPFIVTIDNQPWLQDKDTIELLKKRLNDNLEKKVQQVFCNNEIKYSESFIEEIKITNKYPIKYKYKSIILLGNKVSIKIKSDKSSQLKALMAIALGLGEKGSSLGAGFCSYR
ncbi:CRISPR-associated endoribonuclease Cas6 [uncultured Clostridium sp.]|uniref:CRISPR-associated endoribonuclease Cas6 n=1 Tax=uncultured Clostridium sp. TaxID=59620 RepID=UPI0025D8D795|nr:CRISPR-associated endoribonuclease Cas6 [uncultured Clostridium sp.]